MTEFSMKLEGWRKRLPQRVMFGELVGGKGYSGGKEKD